MKRTSSPRLKWILARARQEQKTGLTDRRKLQLLQSKQRRERVYDLLIAPDASEPAIFDAKDRDALRQTIFCAFQCDEALKSYRRAKTIWGRQSAAFDACIDIRSSTTDREQVTLVAKFIPGIRIKARESSSVSGLMREHTALLKELEAKGTGEERRLSVLLDLVKVEQLLLGYWWDF